MSRDKQILAGVVVLAALGGLVWVRAKKDREIGSATVTSADLPEIKSPDDVDKISLTNGDKGEVVLQKKGDKWEVTKPVTAPANAAAIKSLIDNMKELKTKEQISSSVSDDEKKDYQLDAAKGVHVVTFKGGDKKVDLVFGKSGGRGQIVLVDGKPGLYAATGYSSYLYARELKGWRDGEIFKFDDANANQVTVDTKKGTFSFTKADDKWAGTFKGKAIDRYDPEKVKDLLRAFKALNAEDFGDGKSDADTGIAEPDSTVSIQMKDGAGKYILKVGKVASGSNRFAKKDGNDTVFVISSWAADWAVAEEAKFQHPVDGGAKDAGGAGMPHPMQMPGMPGMGGMPPGMGGMDDEHGH